MKTLSFIFSFLIIFQQFAFANTDDRSSIKLVSNYRSSDIVSIQINSHSLLKYPTFGKVSFVYKKGREKGKTAVSTMNVKESDFKAQANSELYTLSITHDLSMKTLLNGLRDFKKAYGFDPNPEILKVRLSFRNAFPEEEQPFVGTEFTLQDLFAKVDLLNNDEDLLYKEGNLHFIDRGRIAVRSQMNIRYIHSQE